MIAFDTETALFRPGLSVPRLVCASLALAPDTASLLDSPEKACQAFRFYAEQGEEIAFAHAPFDLAVLAKADPSLVPVIFRALDNGQIFDVLIAESLHAIGRGHLGKMPDGSDLRSPSSGRAVKRYSLELVTFLNLGRRDAKARDDWRLSYALLDGIPASRWPEAAREYPLDDVRNTLEVALRQKQTHENLENLPAQVRAAVALHLGAAHGLRVDGAAIDALAAKVDGLHAEATARFMAHGFIRPDGVEDQAAIKRAVAVAYGAGGVCDQCGGERTVFVPTFTDCRGPKVRGRFTGCAGAECSECGGRGKIAGTPRTVACKVQAGANGKVYGCDGTGLDLSTAPFMPRTAKGGIATDRDALLESGDDVLSDFAENEFEKSRTTYVPYLRTGVSRPLSYSPNVLVATGRCSYEGSPLHQMPRVGGERETIRARGAWCGYPVEMVLGSTDYEAGELCSLAQVTHWLFGDEMETKMIAAINEGPKKEPGKGKPGVLHSDLAASILGLPLDEFLKRLKAKDKTCTDFRQMAKAINFGTPGGMGSTKLVVTSRKKNAGFTLAADGPAKNAKGEPGYWGVRFCILTGKAQRCSETKIASYKGRPCPPVCKICVEVVEEGLRPAYFKRYPEVKRYFDEVKTRINRNEPAPCYAFDPSTGKHKVIRYRRGCDFPSYCNNGFQALLSDVGKEAYYRATVEAYTGRKPDGSPSPLFGSRLPIYLHDEPLSELLLSTAHEAGPRIAEIMIEAGDRLAPDVTWRAETAIAFRWAKGMEPVKVNGKLVPWDGGK